MLKGALSVGLNGTLTLPNSTELKGIPCLAGDTAASLLHNGLGLRAHTRILTLPDGTLRVRYILRIYIYIKAVRPLRPVHGLRPY